MGKAGLSFLAVVGAGFVLASCFGAPTYPTNVAGPQVPAQPPPVSAPITPPRAPAPRPQDQARDQCGAAALQGLVGRPKSDIPVPIQPSRQRVACTACAVTMDYNPVRLNFFFDTQTGRIKEIRCG